MAVFTAFSDESGAQDPGGSFLVGGCIADPDTWTYFVRAWQERVLNSPPPIPYLHMIEVRRPRWQQQRGLSHLQATDKVCTAVNIIATTGGVSTIFSEMKRSMLEENVCRKLRESRITPGLSFSEPDYLCFLGYAFHVLHAIHGWHPEARRVDFVIARKNKVTDHLRTFHEDLKKHATVLFPALAPLVGRLIPGEPDDSPALQAADVFCWHVRRFIERGIQDDNLSSLWHGNGHRYQHTWTANNLDQLATAIVGEVKRL